MTEHQWARVLLLLATEADSAVGQSKCQKQHDICTSGFSFAGNLNAKLFSNQIKSHLTHRVSECVYRELFGLCGARSRTPYTHWLGRTWMFSQCQIEHVKCKQKSFCFSSSSTSLLRRTSQTHARTSTVRVLRDRLILSFHVNIYAIQHNNGTIHVSNILTIWYLC